MPCPHFKITIIKRSENGSSVSAVAYQSGDRLFSEYDQRQKYYPHKNEVVHKEVLLPPHAPPEYADRNVLWNAAEAQEKQWNSQLARRVVLAIPREIPRSQHAGLIRDYCREFFVSKGMIADFAIHDKGDGNPHAHIMLTLRAMDEKGKWLPKSRKVYDLDINGERIRLPSGRWKSHKENTADWNDRKYAEIWRQGWADTANRYLEANNCPERLDMRSYARQGIDKIPTVHMGPAACQMEKKGIATDAGNLNRDIETANALMQSIHQTVGQLKGWVASLTSKKDMLLEALGQMAEPTLPDLLQRYLEMHGGKEGGVSADSAKVHTAIDFLHQKGISTVESLDAHLNEASNKAVSFMDNKKKNENQMGRIDTMLAHIHRYEAYKPVYLEYASIGWKRKKERFAEHHQKELDAFDAAVRYFKANLDGKSYSRKDLEVERERLAASLSGQRKRLEAVWADAETLRNVRDWINQILPPGQRRATAGPGKKPSITQTLAWKREARQQEKEAQRLGRPPKKHLDMEL